MTGARGWVGTNLIWCVNTVIYYLWITRFIVQVKIKPCTRRTGYMRLISWTHPRGSGIVTNFPLQKVKLTVLKGKNLATSHCSSFFIFFVYFVPIMFQFLKWAHNSRFLYTHHTLFQKKKVTSLKAFFSFWHQQRFSHKNDETKCLF